MRAGTGGPTATPTATRTPTIQGGGGVPPNGIPTLSFPMLVLMGLAHLESICNRLIAGGRDPNTPAAAIAAGTCPEQRGSWGW